MWPALIAGAAQLGATAVNYQSQVGSNETNIGLAELQNRYNLEQWYRENQFNLPEEQVKRLRAAGINPGLAYANGSMTNEAAASPQMVSGRVQAPYINPVDLSAIHLNEANANKANADAAKSNAEVGLIGEKVSEVKSNVKLLDAKAESLGYENQLAASTLAQRIAAAAAKADADKSQAELSKQQAEEAKNYVERTMKAQWDQLDASAKKALNDKLISDKEYDIIQERLKQEQAKTNIVQYEDKMKEWSYWIDVADKALRHVEGIIGLFTRLGVSIVPPDAPSMKTVQVPGSESYNDDDVPDVFN